MSGEAEWPVIYAYTRAQAIADGELVDVSATAREAGWRFPVAMTRAAYEDCVAWTPADNARKGACQDETGRLWDVLWMSALAARRKSNGPSDTRLFQLYRVPRDSRGIRPRLTTLKMVCGPGDDASPVVTIMLPDED